MNRLCNTAWAVMEVEDRDRRAGQGRVAGCGISPAPLLQAQWAALPPYWLPAPCSLRWDVEDAPVSLDLDRTIPQVTYLPEPRPPSRGGCHQKTLPISPGNAVVRQAMGALAGDFSPWADKRTMAGRLTRTVSGRGGEQARDYRYQRANAINPLGMRFRQLCADGDTRDGETKQTLSPAVPLFHRLLDSPRRCVRIYRRATAPPPPTTRAPFRPPPGVTGDDRTGRSNMGVLYLVPRTSLCCVFHRTWNLHPPCSATRAPSAPLLKHAPPAAGLLHFWRILLSLHRLRPTARGVRAAGKHTRHACTQNPCAHEDTKRACTGTREHFGCTTFRCLAFTCFPYLLQFIPCCRVLTVPFLR